jgi:hypothetical protein
MWLGAAMAAPLLMSGPAALALPVAGQGLAPPRTTAPAGAVQATGLAAGVPFCRDLATGRVWGSAGARLFCFGPQPSGPATAVPVGAGRGLKGVPRNVDAASLAEDISPAGTRGEGQSETSIAAAGRYVVEDWNDATGSVSPCPSPMAKEEAIGFGFSADGGKSFTDLGGLPNLRCRADVYRADPSVAAYRVGGRTFFYLAGLFDPASGGGRSKVAMDACQVTGTGGTAGLRCGQPVTMAASTQCKTVPAVTNSTAQVCSFLDKPYITIDPAHGRLYLAYTEFLLRGSRSGQEELAVCDLGTRRGATGPAGGTPAAPVCEHGSKLVPAGTSFRVGQPYFTVARQDPAGCENLGSYPAADPATGNVLVGYEYNLDTSLAFPQCLGAATPVSEVLTQTLARCLAVKAVSPCSRPATRIRLPIVSLRGTFVPGYTGFTNDFPRLAVSDRYHTVTMVWNDTRHHPYGDILLQSFRLGSLRPVQPRPVTLDRPHHGGLSMFPALRLAAGDGRLDVSWYSRPGPATDSTSVVAAVGISPRIATTPPNIQITGVASNWANDSSLIVPNFGDYTDGTIAVTGTPPYTANTLYIAWSDGRLGVPQPFEAHMPAG